MGQGSNHKGNETSMRKMEIKIQHIKNYEIQPKQC